MRRVVVTGIGGFLPCGDSCLVAWNDILEGNSWIKSNTLFDTSNLRNKVCGFLNIDDSVVEKYSFLVSQKEKRRIDDFEYIAIISAYNAMMDCDLLDKEFDKENFGTFIASGIGGIKTIASGVKELSQGKRHVSPFFLPAALANMCSGNIAIKFGLKGASMTHVSACASSTHAIGEAFNYIRSGRLNGCLTGGAESAVCDIAINAFDAMNALSSNFNDQPAKASRALDKSRDGFVMSEGSVVLMLEELEYAKNRGAKIYCEVAGYGASCDAGHITAPDPNGEGACRAMKLAIDDANIKSDKIDYINLHGTSTPLGDKAEITAIKNLFGGYADKIAISSTKSVTGHLLGATGALEAMVCCKTIQEQIVPPSINIEELDECCAGMNIVQKATKTNVDYAMSNSFGFGGTNGCLIFKRYNND